MDYEQSINTITNHINNDNNDNIDNIDNINSKKDVFKSVLLKNYDEKQEEEYDNDEDILDESNFKLCLKPITPGYEMLWDLYNKQVDSFWTAQEIDFIGDKKDYDNLSEDRQHFVKNILSFFAGSDSIVNINIDKQFSRIMIKEAEVTYKFQAMMENIHGETYADMLLNLLDDKDEIDYLINGFKEIESIKKLTEWAFSWIDSKRRIGFHIMAFTIFEGILFSGAFAAIYWLKKDLGQDKMKGFFQSNKLIAKDEGMHTNFGCMIYSFVKNKLSKEESEIMIKEGVDIAKEFMKDTIKIDMIGMTVELMDEYLEYIGDNLSCRLGYDKIYNTQIPESFKFMESIGFLNKDNFFERRPTEYQRAVTSNNTVSNYKFEISDVY